MKKTLDSLALMLVLASGTVSTPSMQDSVRNQIERLSPVLDPSIDSTVTKNQIPHSMVAATSRKETGTFRASEIHWAKDSQEIYFEGEVKVKFKEQNFRGNGSFNFLGKVQLLIVEGQQIDLGRKIKLSNNDYNLVVLNTNEAISKYGEQGQYGAVEISRSN